MTDIIQVTGRYMFMNIGTVVPNGNTRRQWNPCKSYGFLTAGHGIRYKKYISNIQVGDAIFAYESKAGYYGIGIVTASAIRIRDFSIDGKSLKELSGVRKELFDTENDVDNSEYAIAVNWIKTLDRPIWFGKESPYYYAPRSTVAKMREETRLELCKRLKLHLQLT